MVGAVKLPEHEHRRSGQKPRKKALDDEGFRATAAAADALRKITGRDLGLDPEKWRKWWEENKPKFRQDR
jgi:hypothetical protein